MGAGPGCHRLVPAPLPPNLAPGTYALEIGAYNSMTTERLPLLDQLGAPVAGSLRWGSLQVR